jgi:septum formation protein
LTDLGLDFIVRAAELDESLVTGESAKEHVERLAAAKSRAGTTTDDLVLAADTVVVIDDEILGKPTDDRAARTMLGRLAGRRHTVLTGVAVRWSGSERCVVGTEVSEVEIAAMNRDEIDWYVGTGEPLDKAGSYAIQGLGALFVLAVTGNYTNVVGLPLPLTRALFLEVGFDLLQFRGAGRV